MSLYQQNKVELDFNNIFYKFLKKLSERIVGLGAIIFGGFVRDVYIHNHYASLFYQQNRSNDYNDPKIHPESAHRLIVPKDIDIFVNGSRIEVNNLYEKLRKFGYQVRANEVFHENEDYPFPKNVFHDKVNIGLTFRHIFPFDINIKMDVLFSELSNVKPPFGKCDLSCNSLIYDKNGIHLPQESEQTEEEILSDISQLRAKVCYESDDVHRRARKMCKRGWTIEGVKWFDESEFSSSNCCKCSNCGILFNDKDKVIFFYCCSTLVHKDCFKTCRCGKVVI